MKWGLVCAGFGLLLLFRTLRYKKDGADQVIEQVEEFVTAGLVKVKKVISRPLIIKVM